jgi:hypothetical protein
MRLGNRFNWLEFKKFKEIKISYLNKIISLIIASLGLINTNRNFLFSSLVTAIFYLPSLKDGSIGAGFLYTGDVLGWYLPALAKTHSLIHEFNLFAIDYSTFNGSSDFYLSPNFFSYHPVVVIYCLLISPETTTIQQLGHFFVLLMALHSFLAIYFSLKLCNRFLTFEFGAAALTASVFAYSIHMLNSLGQPVFLLCSSVTPWVAYAVLAYVDRPSFRLLVFASLPIIFGLLGGYMPLAVASLALSVIIVATKLLYLDSEESNLDKRIYALLISSMPYALAMVIVGPYIYAIIKFHKETLSAGFGSLYYSAHQYAQLPQNLLTIFSTRFHIPGSESEFTITWGFIAISVGLIFLFSTNALNALEKKEWKLFKISALIYFATVLATFGDFSVVSDLVYYLVPQVGRMHNYQRFFIAAELTFGIMLTLMLKAIIQARPFLATRVMLTTLGLTTLALALLMAFKPALSREIGINSYILIELFIGFLFTCSLLVPSKNFIYGAFILLFSLPLLNRMYDYSQIKFSLDEQRKSKIFALNEDVQNRIISYFNKHSNKQVIKYIDITPMWQAGTVSALYADTGIETFPKVFPDFVLNKQRLSSYGGFTFYLSSRSEYMRKMPVEGVGVTVKPDWEYLTNTGADFLVALDSDVQSGALGALFAKVKTEDVLRLPNDVVILPLRGQSEKTLKSERRVFDNGYLAISQINNGNTNNLVNIALDKNARQSSNAGADAKLAIDGNTNGNFNLGSVSHTLRDTNAWFEIDLGATEPIENVTIWNRTDCCGYCLGDYWVFISDKPFKDSDTAADLKRRPGTWSQQNFAPNPKGVIETEGVRGRYVRIQLPGDATTPKDCFLSLAEVQVFRLNQSLSEVKPLEAMVPLELKINSFQTNHANYLSLDFFTSAPVAVQYLFFDNPRLTYYLNGKRINPIEKEGSRFIHVEAGHNTVEIKYVHWTLVMFLVFYALYAVLYLWVIIPGKFLDGIWHKQ